MVGNTFSIDLSALNDLVGNNHTEYGYYIEVEYDCYYDLRGSDGLYACDGEVCEVVDEYANVVVVRNVDHDLFGEFKFNKEEFAVIAH